MTIEPLIHIPSAPGEFLDKISILQIKSERIEDENKLENIKRELEFLRTQERHYIPDTQQLSFLAAELKAVNERIWDMEDTIRDCERAKDFGPLFIDTARKIYKTNDERAAIKRNVNVLLGSQIVEEKSYADY